MTTLKQHLQDRVAEGVNWLRIDQILDEVKEWLTQKQQLFMTWKRLTREERGALKELTDLIAELDGTEEQTK